MFNRYLWECVLCVNPFTKPEEVEELVEINEWDLLIVYKDGSRIIFDRSTGYHRNVFYDSIYELTIEQEKRELARRMRVLMLRAHLTQEQLADMIDISRPMISNYLTGRNIPNAITLKKIAKALKCSMDDFFYRDF